MVKIRLFPLTPLGASSITGVGHEKRIFYLTAHGTSLSDEMTRKAEREKNKSKMPQCYAYGAKLADLEFVTLRKILRKIPLFA